MSNEKTMTVVGGGLVGASIAYGAAKAGVSVRVLDQGDVAFRASRGNFGLVWVQSKGQHLGRYARWSRDSSRLWPAFHQELLDLTDVDTQLQQPGGFWLGFSDAEVATQARILESINNEVSGIPYQMMGRAELKGYLPGLGPAVVGGSYCPLDGHVNPLMLLRALHAALHRLGVELIAGVDVTQIQHNAGRGTFELRSTDGRRFRSERLVLAAGLGNERLASQVGLNAPVVPVRGQVLITERLKPFLHYPVMKFRQTNEGTVQIGSTNENVGLDDRTTTDKIEALARRAVATFPALARARLVRAWGSLRPMSPDGYPIYEESTSCPGAYVATCHSGVTLAAAHSVVVAPWMAGISPVPPDFGVFKSARFANPETAFHHENSGEMLVDAP